MSRGGCRRGALRRIPRRPTCRTRQLLVYYNIIHTTLRVEDAKIYYSEDSNAHSTQRRRVRSPTSAILHIGGAAECSPSRVSPPPPPPPPRPRRSARHCVVSDKARNRNRNAIGDTRQAPLKPPPRLIAWGSVVLRYVRLARPPPPPLPFHRFPFTSSSGESCATTFDATCAFCSYLRVPSG